ncbi:MAG: radical SAM family heme chaperone HemW [Candidatus Omnitrophica bacterium]|nr:radical SAM family heme chaperone HemW [Candidatus Omnitrophota bacterium]
MSLSLYIHIPFCKRKCPYCDFYSIGYDRELAVEYVNDLSEQIKKINYRIRTVHIGGGTPTVLEPVLLRKLLDALSKILKRSRENTVEVNPESLTREKLDLFRNYGLNRISIGVQSINDDKLKFLGRLHDSRQALTAVQNSRKAGFRNISVDLIYGLPGESLKNWKSEIKEISRLPVKHISCYSLGCEPGTRFYKFKKRISDQEVAGMYIFNMRFLPERGFFQYEVSNFSFKTFESLHNLNYWQGGDYLGLGPSAASFLKGERLKNIADIKEYLKRIRDKKDYISYRERLNPLKRAKEFAALSIRTKKGINVLDFKRKTGFDFFRVQEKAQLEKFKDKGLIKLSKKDNIIHKIFLTEKGFLFCDEVSSEFI